MRGVLASVLGMINGGATHVGVATDHVIESFRNDLWPGYKTGAGIEPDLLAQFPLLEEALAGARRRRLADGRVRGRRCAGGGGGAGGARIRASSAWSSARPTRTWRSACAARASCSWTGGRARSSTRPASSQKFGVPPGVDSRLPRARRRRRRRLSRPARLGREVGGGGAGAVRPPRGHPGGLARRGASTPRTPRRWRATLARERERALLFRDLATLRTDIPLFDARRRPAVEGPDAERFAPLAARLEPPR